MLHTTSLWNELHVPQVVSSCHKAELFDNEGTIGGDIGSTAKMYHVHGAHGQKVEFLVRIDKIHLETDTVRFSARIVEYSNVSSSEPVSESSGVSCFKWS